MNGPVMNRSVSSGLFWKGTVVNKAKHIYLGIIKQHET